MFKLTLERKSLVFLFSIVVTGVILVLDSPSYFKPYNLSPQESLAGYHAHGIALANFAGLGPNPFVARNIDVDTGTISLYHHWPNGFFFSALFLKIFGNTYLTGRSIAIVFSAIGMFFLVAALMRENNISLLHMVIPLTFLSAMGRDAIPFFFADAALSFFIGLMLYLAVRRFNYRLGNGLFWSFAFIAPFFNQLIILFVFGYVIVSFLFHRNSRLFFVDVSVLAASTVIILLALAWDGGHFGVGFQDLKAIFLYRTSIVNIAEPISFYQSVRATVGTLYSNVGIFFILLVPIWIVIILARDWWAAALLPIFLAYSLVFKNYTGHHFTKLMLVVFAFVTFLVGAFYAGRFIHDHWKVNLPWEKISIGSVFSLLIIAVLTHRQNMQYRVDGAIDNTRVQLEQLDPQTYASCTQFNFKVATSFFDPSDRMAQYYFGTSVLDKINNRLPDKRCRVVIGENGVAVTE